MTSFPSHESQVQELLDRYTRIGFQPPDWAFPLAPSIPFVGKEYARTSPRIAAYASAENLSHYQRGSEPWPSFLQDERRFNRHRGNLEWQKEKDKNLEDEKKSFFPQVHIAPVENGGLLCALLYFWTRILELQPPTTPYAFIESLVVGNVGKFSIETHGGPYQDYAGDSEKTGPSLPYFKADLEVLRPDYLLLPKKIYELEEVRTCVPKGMQVLPLMQFAPQVLNIHLASLNSQAEALQANHQNDLLAQWTERIKGTNPSAAFRYFAHLKEVAEKENQK
ncbi:MAG TPA: hypothetical protein ENK02_05575 [Planctomycetes bacterium]|nr:hypothetical protein [Planctomycetota bacterium]